MERATAFSSISSADTHLSSDQKELRLQIPTESKTQIFFFQPNSEILINLGRLKPSTHPDQTKPRGRRSSTPYRKLHAPRCGVVPAYRDFQTCECSWHAQIPGLDGYFDGPNLNSEGHVTGRWVQVECGSGRGWRCPPCCPHSSVRMVMPRMCPAGRVPFSRGLHAPLVRLACGATLGTSAPTYEPHRQIARKS